MFQRLTGPICSVNGKHGNGAAPNNIHKQAYHSVAKCVAAITIVCPQEALPVIHMFLKKLEVSSLQILSIYLYYILLQFFPFYLFLIFVHVTKCDK